MIVWAYCGEAWRRATAGATGISPVASPPVTAATLTWPEKRPDVAVFNLHGDQYGQSAWHGQAANGERPTAVTVQQARAYDWQGCVVFSMVCWSAWGGGQEMARAFLDGGALAFIGSTTEAYGRMRPVRFWERWLGQSEKADGLLRLFLAAYARHPGQPEKALTLAKRWFRRHSWPLDEADRMTLDSFVCLRGDKR